MDHKFQAIIAMVMLCAALCTAADKQNAATQRQSISTASGILSTLGSLVPGVVSNLLPMVFLFGLGALMVPALGLGLLLREGKRRSFPSFNIDTTAIKDTVIDVFDKVIKAIDNVDKKYN